jgi:hypothetical protein
MLMPWVMIGRNEEGVKAGERHNELAYTLL